MSAYSPYTRDIHAQIDVQRSVNSHTISYIITTATPLLYEQLTKGFSAMYVVQVEREFLVYTFV